MDHLLKMKLWTDQPSCSVRTTPPLAVKKCWMAANGGSLAPLTFWGCGCRPFFGFRILSKMVAIMLRDSGKIPWRNSSYCISKRNERTRTAILGSIIQLPDFRFLVKTSWLYFPATKSIARTGHKMDVVAMPRMMPTTSLITLEWPIQRAQTPRQGVERVA